MTAISRIQLSLMLGQVVASPAPQELMVALQSVEIMQQEQNGFQLTFRAERGPGVMSDYTVVSHPLLKPGNRVVISVTLNAMPRVLMDGIITHHDLSANSNGGTQFVVTGTDLTVMMDLIPVSMEYPFMNGTAIALAVLAKYALLGIVPQVIPSLLDIINAPFEDVPQQSDTDLNFLKGLAAEHSNVFFLKPGPLPGQTTAYWGPMGRVGLPQKALTLDAGPASNVDSINFSYDAQKAELAYTEVSDLLSETVLPVPVLTSSLFSSLSRESPFGLLLTRLTRLDYQGSNVIEAQLRAQAYTTQASSSVVTANGSLDVLRYGDILMAPGLVGVRGAGLSYDGNYIVQSVTHHISKGQYTQDFTLAREGVGSLTLGVIP